MPPAPGLLLVLSAPSGAGKTTLARRFVASCAGAAFSVSVTTRAPRGAERDGVDYHFVSPARFAELLAEGALAEWAEVHGARYGTLRSTVERALEAGAVTVFDIDVQGGAQLEALWPDHTVSVFVLPPSMEELERRLRARSTESDEAVRRRLAAAHAEVARGLDRYRYLVVNDELARAHARLAAVVAHERALAQGRHDPEAAAVARELERARFDASAWSEPQLDTRAPRL